MNLRRHLEWLERSGRLPLLAGTDTAAEPNPQDADPPGAPAGLFEKEAAFLRRRLSLQLRPPGPEVLAGLARLPGRSLDPGRLLFLDLETTGLAGGTGTCAFLVGTAWFEEGRLRLEQLIMRDPCEEAAMLARVRERLAGCGGLVTFNGKTFDMQLLATRFVMKRLRVDLESIPHVDLLHPARRLWSGRLPDCRLETLEEHVLGRRRRGDVPGHLIPQLYFRYLRSGEERLLARVARHNEADLAALAELACRLGAALHSPLDLRSAEEDCALARWLVALGHLREARVLLERALEQGLSRPARRAALADLARLHRRQGEAAAAARAWRRILDEDPQDLVAAEELAKHLEHRLGDPSGALALVERALGRADLTPAWRRSLEHRWRRLRRRQKARNQGLSGGLGTSPAG